MGVTIGIVCIVLLIILIFLSVPIGVSFIISGFFSVYLMVGLDTSLALLIQCAYTTIATPSWVAIPLFVLLGALAVESGLANRAFRSVDGFAAGLPGSVGIATTLGNAAFGAISGSSLAAVTVFGKAALPEMIELKYDKSFASGIIAASGTFASLIPPSILFILYGLFTDTSIADLFFAGIIPGLLNAIMFAIYIFIIAKNSKELTDRIEATASKNLNFKQRMSITLQIWPVAVVAIVILGGIYKGIFTPTEAAAVGSVVIIGFGIMDKKIKKENIFRALKDSTSTTSTLFLINVGALFYAKVLVLSNVPSVVSAFLMELKVLPVFIVIMVCILYLFLGMIMVPVGIYAMTLPIITPVLIQLGYDPVWFGVVTVLLMGVGSVTPPVGMNVYALKSVAPKNISLNDMFKGIWPFVFIDILLITIVIAFPQISLWLPSLLNS